MAEQSKFEEYGYTPVKQLADGRWIGVYNMAYTTGLFVDLDEAGYDHRYCYEHRRDTVAALEAWDGTGDPPGPWIKQKGAEGGDRMNPEWARDRV